MGNFFFPQYHLFNHSCHYRSIFLFVLEQSPMGNAIEHHFCGCFDLENHPLCTVSAGSCGVGKGKVLRCFCNNHHRDCGYGRSKWLCWIENAYSIRDKLYIWIDLLNGGKRKKPSYSSPFDTSIRPAVTLNNLPTLNEGVDRGVFGTFIEAAKSGVIRIVVIPVPSILEAILLAVGSLYNICRLCLW